MGMFNKLFGGKGSRQKQLDSIESSIRGGQKTKIPKTKKKKAAPCGIDPTTGEPRGSHWC